MSENKNLVVVRAGDQSLHPDWLKGDSSRNWDLIISYYGSQKSLYENSGFEVVKDNGFKWDSLHRLFTNRPELLEKYDTIWLPDDDLICSLESINRLFDCSRDYDLSICQPSLTHDSYSSFQVTKANKYFRLRYTTFVEVMAPCFNSAYLKEILPLLTYSSSGWGLDLVWCHLMADPLRKAAVIDEISVVHSRPIGKGTLYSDLKSAGKDNYQEQANVLSVCDIQPYRPRTYGGVLRSGRYVSAGLPLFFRVCLGINFYHDSLLGNIRKRSKYIFIYCGDWINKRLQPEKIHFAKSDIK